MSRFDAEIAGLWGRAHSFHSDANTLAANTAQNNRPAKVSELNADRVAQKELAEKAHASAGSEIAKAHSDQVTEVTDYHTEHHNQFDLIYAQTLIAGPSGLQLPSVVSPDGISWSVSAGSHLSGAPGSIVESLLEAFSYGQNTEDTLSAGLGSVVEPAFATLADDAYLHQAKELAQVGSAVYGVWQGCEEMFSKLTTPLAPGNSTTFCVAGPTDPNGLEPPGNTNAVPPLKVTPEDLDEAKRRNRGTQGKTELSISQWLGRLPAGLRGRSDAGAINSQGCIAVGMTVAGKWEVDLLKPGTYWESPIAGGWKGGSAMFLYDYKKYNSDFMIDTAKGILGGFNDPVVFVYGFSDEGYLPKTSVRTPESGRTFSGEKILEFQLQRLVGKPFDTAVFDPRDDCWYGANRGQARPRTNRIPTRIYKWNSLESFMDAYSDIDYVIIGVTERGPGTATYQQPGIPMPLIGFVK